MFPHTTSVLKPQKFELAATQLPTFSIVIRPLYKRDSRVYLILHVSLTSKFFKNIGVVHEKGVPYCSPRGYGVVYC